VEAKGVPNTSDQPQVVAWLVSNETITLLVPGGSRLLVGARFVMEKPLEAAAATTGAIIGRRPDHTVRITQ
jgi:hypothetical protein